MMPSATPRSTPFWVPWAISRSWLPWRRPTICTSSSTACYHVSDDSVYFDRYYKFLGKSEKIGAYPYWAYVYDAMAEQGMTQAEAEAAAVAFFGENYGITDFSYTEWFQVSSTPMTYADNIGLRAGKPVYSYEGWWGYDSMPVVYSTDGSEYRTGNWAEEIIEGENSVNAYWISKGMDGWRLDVANEVSERPGRISATA